METNKDAYLRYDPAKENAWLNAIFDALGPKANDYYKVATQQLVTILIIVIAKKQHEQFISDVEANYVGVGIMNMMGNKGGVGVRLRFHDSYLCFMGCHLAAFTDQVDRRNQDFGEICKRLTFPHRPDALTSYVTYSWNDGGDEGVTFVENEGTLRDWSQTASVFHSDYLIWLGDLNYRINLTEPEIKSHLRQNQLGFLVDYDQLTIERRAGRAFSMFGEGAINFMPTYKYDAGSNQYDSSAKRRAPSWTDRILWKKERARITEAEDDKHEAPLKLVKYQNCMDMMLSDHKPVYALMETKIRKIDSKKQAETRSALVRQLTETQENITKGQISSSFVEFGDVHFMEYKERTLILENTGQVLAPFRFIPKMDENEICPTWLRVHPISGILGPGEKVVIHFEILIDPTISSPFNEAKEEIDNILVLRLENGKDFFIVVTGHYQPTCFGVNLERLALMSLPVSEVAVASDKKKSRKSLRHAASSSSAKNNTGKSSDSTPNNESRLQQQATLPKELWRVLNFLWNKNMLCLDHLFLDHGDRVISEYVRRSLDTGEQFDSNVLLSGKRKQHKSKGAENDNDYDDDDDDSSSNDTAVDNEKDNTEAKDDVNDTVGANSMIDILVAFLECLPEPVIPTSMYKQALLAADSEEAMNQFKSEMPHIHLNVLLYITSFLKDAIKYAPESYRDARLTRIAEIFTVMLRPAPEYKEQNPPLARQKRAKFVLSLLNEYTN
ncbi:Endonuclease/exonuclease/phosphatase [Zychaea mexicana]|uniref:Endonuclease/exonuclease/phosphatase n=1 Tax=Zychaea mexicana TaxID=64656 RepID=UPI0022FEE28F|nr:Endonuclease/exonuclease/phosphatase [Zychaea mexicana]KAI9494141.1 Endonuclease/exonuclease/phosphatase [Zychaea mexicana]